MFASVLCTESLQRTYIEQRILILALGTLGASGNDYRVNYVRALFPNFSTPELLRRTSPCKQVALQSATAPARSIGFWGCRSKEDEMKGVRRAFLILTLLLPAMVVVSSASLAMSHSTKMEATIFSYDGEDFVRNKTTLTGHYAPVTDESGKLTGALFVGVPK
jgi:hypothetical protein